MDRVEQVYEALAKDTKLTELLADGKEGIRADLTSYSGRYPVLCYQVISDVPHLFGDDLELARRVTVQISVLTRNGSDSEIVLRVQKIMNSLGWTRESTNRIMDGRIRAAILRFIVAEVEYE